MKAFGGLANAVILFKLLALNTWRKFLKINSKIAISTGLVLTVSLASALHATTAPSIVRSVDNTGNAFPLSQNIILAQATGGDYGGNDNGDGDDYGNDEGGEGPSSHAFSGGFEAATTNHTNAIVLQLKEGAALCGKTPQAYRIDCLSQNYRETAKKLASRGDYGEARTVLLETAEKLDALVQSNRDSTKPRIRVKTKSGGRKVQTRALTPVKPQRVAALKRQAVPILKEAETKLLRSASSNASNSIHYQRIAAAVSSNKVLLRSS